MHQRGRLIAYTVLSGLIALHMYVAVVNSSYPGQRGWFDIPAVVIDGIVATLFVPLWLTPISLAIAGAAIAFMIWVVINEERRHSRWRAAKCPVCGYPRGDATRCSECGQVLAAPSASIKGWRYVVWFVSAWVVGVLAAHVSLNIERQAFERMVERERAANEQAVDRIERRRWWPASSESLLYIEGRGIIATD